MTVDPTTLPGWRWLPGMLAIPTAKNDDGIWYRILMTGGDGAVYSLTDEDFACRMDADEDFAALSRRLVPAANDAATGGCLIALLGPEAWRVRYSPSHHKQAAGMPWVADLVSTVTLHPSQGEAALAVAEALGRWGGV